jgi:hypothetical protein
MAGDEILYFLEKYKNHDLVVNPLLPRTKKAYLNDWQLLPRESLISEVEKAMARWGEINLGIRLDGLTVLDIERPELWFLFFTEAPEVVGQYTWVCRTGSGGYHIYFRGETDIKGCKADEFAELLSSSKHYVVAPPSIHPDTGRRYEWVSDIEKVVVGDVSESGLLRLKQKINALKKYSALIETLVGVWKPEHRHELSLGLSGVLRKTNVPLEEAESVVKTITLLAHDPEGDDRLRALRDTYSKPLSEVAAWSKLKQELVSIVGPEKAEQLLGLLPRPKESEESKKIRYAPFVELEDGRLCEVCFNGKESFFVVYDQSSGRFEKLGEVGDGEIIYRPLNSPEVGRIVVLPSDVEEYGRDSELFNQIHDFLSRYHYSPNGWEKKLDALYVMLTWIYDVLPIVPYRKLTGPKGSGKSTWLKVMGSICYRGLFISGASSEASLLRLIDRWRGTLLIDEADLGDSSFLSTLVKALNVGFDRKMGYFTRCERDDPSHVDTFYVFGPKIAATREPFSDDALESRFITTRPFKQPYARFLGQTFEAEAESLRNKLLLWRLRNYLRIKDRARLLEDPSLHKTIFGDGGVDPRVAQILLPLLILTEDDGLRKSVIRLGELLTLASESDEEALFREAIRIMENEVSPEEEAEIMGEKYLAYWLNVLVERLAPDADLSERKALARKIARILRARGCLIKRGTGGRRLVYIPQSLVSVTSVTESLSAN